MANLNEVPTPPEAMPEAPPEAVKPRFGRKLYLVIGLVAIVIIAAASILVVTQFLPGARGEPVTLGLNYSEGEKMTYEISMTVEAPGMEETLGGTWEMEVLSFDGEIYTIRQTMTFDGQESSFTMKMNQTGHMIGLPPEFGEEFSSMLGVPGLGSYFTKEEIRVGESWQIPFEIPFDIGVEILFEGTMSYKLSKITSVTVPAGTYEALKINIKSSGLSLTYSMEGMDFSLTMNINGYVYLEKATCRLIELSLDQSATMRAAGQSASMETTMQMQLIEHVW